MSQSVMTVARQLYSRILEPYRFFTLLFNYANVSHWGTGRMVYIASYHILHIVVFEYIDC